MYGEWLRSIQPQGEGAMLASMIRKIVLQVGVNLALVVAIFFSWQLISRCASAGIWRAGSVIRAGRRR